MVYSCSWYGLDGSYDPGFGQFFKGMLVGLMAIALSAVLIDSVRVIVRRLLLLCVLFSLVVSLNVTSLSRIFSHNLGHVALVGYLSRGDRQQLVVASGYFHYPTVRGASGGPAAWRLAYILFHLGEYEAAADSLSQARSQNRPEFLLPEQSGEYHVLRAILAERNQDWPLALLEYRMALALAPRPWDLVLYQRYYHVLAYSSDSKGQEVARQILGYLGGLTVLEPTGILISDWAGDNQPPYAVEGMAKGCWILSSFRYDQQALEYGPLVPMQLIWRRVATEAGMNSKDSSLIDGRSVQSILGINLAPNAGFEWDGRTGTYYPLGYTESIYQDSLSNHVLLSERRAGRFTTVASLRNDPLHIYSSYISRTIPVRRDLAYLQAGWMRSEGGLAYLGRHWMDNELNSTPLYTYVKGTLSDREWKLYASLVKPPQSAGGAVLWLLNFDATGNAYFDDLLFVPLQIPPC